jgi:hypothetical protein
MKFSKSVSKVASDINAYSIFENGILIRICARYSLISDIDLHIGGLFPPGEPFPRGERTRASSFLVFSISSTSHFWLEHDLITHVEGFLDCPNFQNVCQCGSSSCDDKVTGDSTCGHFELLRVTRNGRASHK